MKKKIGIIGSGIVGQTLANGFLKHGYEVMIGTNTPAKREELQAKTNGKADGRLVRGGREVRRDRRARDQGHGGGERR